MRDVLFVFMITIGWSLPVGGALAQDTVSGNWAVTGAAAEGVTDGGGTWSRRSISGTLNLTQRDSNVAGTWTGPQGAPWQLTGRVESATFELRTETRQMPVVIDGAQTTVAMRWTFRVIMDKDTLTGTMALHREEEQAVFAQPLTARRK